MGLSFRLHTDRELSSAFEERQGQSYWPDFVGYADMRIYAPLVAYQRLSTPLLPHAKPLRQGRLYFEGMDGHDHVIRDIFALIKGRKDT